MKSEIGNFLIFPKDKLSKLVGVIAFIMCVFQLWVTITMRLEPLKLRATHIGFILVLVFLTFPATNKLKKEKMMSIFDVLLAIIPILTTLYVYVEFNRLSNRIDLVTKLTVLDYIVFSAVVLMVIEATRRTTGLALVIIMAVFILYSLFAKYLPHPFYNKGLTVAKLIDQLAMNISGIYGTPVGVASTYVFLFILLGAFLLKTGAGQSVIDIATALTGKSKGGPAKVAVIGSMLFGTINGSSVANVIAVGPVTIPMMKGLGYKKEFAGAVEAVASTGGQILPPIMGAAAFVMAEVMSTPYIDICKAAIFPAILYYIAVFFMVHLEADKLNLPTMPKNDFKKAGILIKNVMPLFLPVVALLTTLIMGYSPIRAGLVGLTLLVLIGIIQKNNRLTPRRIIEGLIEGAKGALVVSTTCAAAGVVTGIINAMGIGFTFTSAVFTMAGGHLVFGLILVMVATLIVGMGLPTTAAYVIAATVVVPPLIQMGVTKMAAHFFAFYFACLSSITPPVAVAAFAGAALAGSSPIRTCVTATRLGISGFIVPFLFVFNPELLLSGNVIDIIFTIPLSIIGVFGVSCGLEGWIFTRQNILFRLLLFIGGIALIVPGIISDLIGFVLLAPLVIYSYKQSKKITARKSQVISQQELDKGIEEAKIDQNIIAGIDVDSDA